MYIKVIQHIAASI